MNAATLTAFLVAWLLGSLMVAAFSPPSRRLRDELGLILSLGVIVGLGATSVIFLASHSWRPGPRGPPAQSKLPS